MPGVRRICSGNWALKPSFPATPGNSSVMGSAHRRCARTAKCASLAFVPLVRETGRPAKANLSIDDGILAAIDTEAARRKLTRSAFVELMAKHALAELAG